MLQYKNYFIILTLLFSFTFSSTVNSNNINNFLYYYTAKVTDVYDGDTVTVDISLGFDIVLSNQKIRLYGINAPELKGHERKKGIISRDWLKGKILNKEVVLYSHKDSKGKYGRWLGTIIFENKNMNDELVNKGLAEYASY